VDGSGTDGTQIPVGQLTARLQDQILQEGIGATGLVRGTRAIREVHPIQPLALGPLDPVCHRRHLHGELLGYRTQRLAPPDRGYHGFPTLDLTLCLLMELPRNGSVLGKL